MSKDDFEKRLCIAYLDEATVYPFAKAQYNAVASMIARKTTYINDIENIWVELRKQYGVVDGTCLHFTDIKALLNPVYMSRPPKRRNLDMEKIFLNSDNTLDTVKLHSFYIDVLDIINKSDFTLQVSGMRFDKTSFMASTHIRKYGTGLWYPLFRKHLDSMVYFLMYSSYQEHEKELIVKPKANFNNLIAKIRYDGDIDLTSRNDLRDAFSHYVTNGTERFNSSAVKACLDEVRFIDKSEIGFCVSCDVNGCNSKLISHAGNEILDFMTIFAARSIAYEDNIQDLMIEKEINEVNARKKVDEAFQIRINGYSPIEPLTVINSKIFRE